MYKIVVTQPAEQDLRQAVQYIGAELQNPTAAVDLLNSMDQEIGSLSEMPRRNPLVQDPILAECGFRLLQVKSYLVFYIVREEQNSVVVHRILYGHRDWQNLI